MDSKTVIKAKDLLKALPGSCVVAPAKPGDFAIVHTDEKGVETTFTLQSEVVQYVKDTPSLSELHAKQPTERARTNGRATDADVERAENEGLPPPIVTADGYNDGDPEARVERPAGD